MSGCSRLEADIFFESILYLEHAQRRLQSALTPAYR